MPPTATMATATYTANPWQFAGAFYDSTTGLYKFGIRYYDPTLGRWTQQDPLGGSLFDPSTGNRYIYADDDPTNLTDPHGSISVSGGAIYFTNSDVGFFLLTAATTGAYAIAAALDFVSTLLGGPVATVLVGILAVIGLPSLGTFAYQVVQAGATGQGAYIGVTFNWFFPNIVSGTWCGCNEHVKTCEDGTFRGKKPVCRDLLEMSHYCPDRLISRM